MTKLSDEPSALNVSSNLTRDVTKKDRAKFYVRLHGMQSCHKISSITFVKCMRHWKKIVCFIFLITVIICHIFLFSPLCCVCCLSVECHYFHPFIFPAAGCVGQNAVLCDILFSSSLTCWACIHNNDNYGDNGDSNNTSSNSNNKKQKGIIIMTTTWTTTWKATTWSTTTTTTIIIF